MKSKYRNLIIIGNGFDRWQGLPSSYEEFRKYYYSNIKRISKELKAPVFTNDDGELITPVEMIYGDIFNPKRIENDFFWNFETSTAFIDDQRINLYFGKTSKGVKELEKAVRLAIKILQKAFSEWACSIDVSKKDSGFRFDESCFCVSFNYTDTLEKRFGVSSDDICYIHGKKDNEKSIVVGHSTHPEQPFKELIEQKEVVYLGKGKSKRLMELYYSEQAFFNTDKHIQDNIDKLSSEMALRGVHIEDIENIYVLGHSFGASDYEYFDFLNSATQVGCDLNSLSAPSKVDLDFFQNLKGEKYYSYLKDNIGYASHHRERELNKKSIPFSDAENLERIMTGEVHQYSEEDAEKEKEAVSKRFIFEQSVRTKRAMNNLASKMGKAGGLKGSDCLSVLAVADYIDGGHDKRTSNAKWHISYHSDDDKARIKKVLEDVGCKDSKLYQTIDECIEEFRNC